MRNAWPLTLGNTRKGQACLCDCAPAFHVINPDGLLQLTFLGDVGLMDFRQNCEDIVGFIVPPPPPPTLESLEVEGWEAGSHHKSLTGFSQ